MDRSRDCAGRGAYGAGSLGSLPLDHPAADRADSLRAEYGLESLLDLDGADGFDPMRHLRPANASALIFMVTLLDAERAADDHEVVAVIGNSLGWYSALANAASNQRRDSTLGGKRKNLPSSKAEKISTAIGDIRNTTVAMTNSVHSISLSGLILMRRPSAS